MDSGDRSVVSPQCNRRQWNCSSLIGCTSPVGRCGGDHRIEPLGQVLATVDIDIGASDACDPNAQCRVIQVTSNEPDSGNGKKDRANDIEIVDDNTVRLRQERSGKNRDGRIYTVTVECSDAAGRSTQSAVVITVPHSYKMAARSKR